MDWAHEWTDEEIARLERRIAREYGTALRDMRGKLDRFLKKYASELEAREKALDDTPEAHKELEGWKRDRAADRAWLQGMVDSLSADVQQAQARAMALVEDRLPRVYCENADFAAFEVDRAARADTAFTLTDEDTARQLMGRGELLFEPPRPDAAKVAAWTDRKITGAVTQGILQGESVPRIAGRVAEVAGMSRRAAVRTARTACTGAENAGRVSSYQRAQRLGIGLRQEWLATLDMRTRDSHRLLDGERAEVGEEFSNGLRFPGDPQGPAAEVYNCRCTLVAAVDGVDQSAAARFDRLPEGMTYEEWRDQARRRMEGELVGEPDVVRVPERQVVEGRDILGTWQRRPDQFDFEIEDVLDAQGFDGLPRVVDADEFDQAVRAANGGDGLVMQRTYSAPTQEVLDSYRDMLYDGKWYVDCSDGGSVYGKGMYTSASYDGTITQQIKSDMNLYRSTSESRIGGGVPIQNATVEEQNEAIRRAVKEAYGTASAEELAAIEDAVKFQTGLGDKVEWARAGEAHGIVDGNFDFLSISSEVQSSRVGGAVSYVETMTMDPSARIVTVKDLDQMRGYSSIESRLVDSMDIDEGRKSLLREWIESEEDVDWADPSVRDLAQRLDERADELMGMDQGTFAAAMGYDAISVDTIGGGSNYTVVLNRTKLIIRRP